MSNLHISISAEPVAHLGSFVITNSMLTSLVVTVFIVLFALAANRSLKSTGKPSKFQSMVEMMIESLHNLVIGIAGEGKRAAIFGPVVVSFFFFIIFNNWVGLIPGVGTIGFMEQPEVEKVEAVQPINNETEAVAKVDEHGETQVVESTEAVIAPTQETAVEEVKHEAKFIPYFRAATADLNTTIALALISVALTQVFGLMFQKVGYLTKFFNFKSPIGFLLGLLELVLETAKIASFSFRLFGNVFAGEVLIAVIMFLVPVIVPMPFYGLEVFVGFIQALVFSLLSLVFFNMATVGHGEEH